MNAKTSVTEVAEKFKTAGSVLVNWKVHVICLVPRNTKTD